jgi:uncharacterized membrane protein YeaQ/YmgE (transglycosylase-associated protein family)
MEILWSILIGIAAGWLAGFVMKTRGIGLVGYLVVGVLGALLSGWVLGVLGFVMVTLVARLVGATIGAIVLIGLVKFLRRKLR